MSKAVFAEQIEEIIAIEGHSDNDETLEAPTSLEFFKAARRSGKADHKADDAGPNIKVLSKALILNAISADQTSIIRATFADLLEDHQSNLCRPARGPRFRGFGCCLRTGARIWPQLTQVGRCDYIERN